MARWFLLVALPFGLGGCLAHLPGTAPTATVGVATVPASFFVATPAMVPPPDPPAGRYTVGHIVALPRDDPRAAYAAPALGQGARFVQLTLRADDLREPRPPDVEYELIGEDGVYAALAAGEWELAIANGTTYSQEGGILFVLPRELRAARLEIVDYYYPRLAPTAGPTPQALPPLVRRVLASFALDRLP